MAKHKMVQSNLVKNSIAAYFAAVEIHNKPGISYRYETVTLLMLNAWELVLKAFIKKNMKHRSIFERNGHTISLDKALGFVAEEINSRVANSFEAVKRNIEEIEVYRNGITHFYCDELEPYIFMLIARSALNYVDFLNIHFSKNIMCNDNLFIMPLGFKLPFKPEDFLSHNVTKYVGSPESIEFVRSIVNTIKDLSEAGVEDSIVLGFDIYLESVKKAKNSDLLAAITSIDEADFIFGKVTHAKFTDDPNAAIVNMSDEEFRKIWKYSYQDLVDWCKENITGFKRSRLFFDIKKEIEKDINCSYTRKLDSHSLNSPSKKFYTDKALEEIKKEYDKRINEITP